MFEIHRSQRLHWIKVHIEEKVNDAIQLFSTEERINGKNTIRTYFYNRKQKYVIVMEPQRSKMDYYLLSAFYLDRTYGEKMIEKKLKRKLPELL